MKVVYRTDRGKIRSHNEDQVGIFTNQTGIYLAMVADGMGGHLAGDVASEIAITTLQSHWEQTDTIDTPDSAEQWFKETIAKVNEKIFTYAKQNQECIGMGTTLVAAICHEKFATIANIGDSRCYLVKEGKLSQLTDDHSLVNELVKTGQISKEDAEHHPRKNVLLRALGTEEQVKMDIKTISFEEGDYLILCSDGLTNKVSDQELFEVILQDYSLEEKADRLIQLANEYGGEDNISIAIVYYDLNEKAGE